MKLISINIEYDRHLKTVKEFLNKEQADVVCLQEILEEDFYKIKKEFNFTGAFQSWSYVRDRVHPDLRGKKQGIAIFAKNIINFGSVFYVGKEENLLKSFDKYISRENYQKNKAFLWANISFNNTLFKFITTQLPVTQRGEVTQYQQQVIDSLLIKLDPFSEFVLCGDMNAPRGKESFERLATIYKDNIPLKYKTSIDQNLHRVKNIQFMVDGLFTTPGYKAAKVKLVDGVSDHMAIVANIDKV